MKKRIVYCTVAIFFERTSGDLRTVCYCTLASARMHHPIGLSLDALRSTLPRFSDAFTLTALLRLSQLMYSTAPLRSLLLAIDGDDDDVLTRMDAGFDLNLSRAFSATV
jgi:hypothetical protein